MLPVKKIFIDSRYKTKDSVSSYNFKFHLPETLLMPHNAGFYIDDIAIPHTWYTIEENRNDKLYMRVSPLNPDPDNNGLIDVIVTIAAGFYNVPDLAAEMQTKIRAQTDFTLPGQPTTNIFQVTYDLRKSTITIFCISSRKFKILTPDDLETQLNGDWNGPSYNTSDPNYFNEILSHLEGNSIFYTSSNPYISNSLNLQSIRNMYIHSPNLGNYNTVGPNGESTIIKKVPVTSGYNEMIFDTVTSASDFLDCSRQTLRTIQFYIRDSRGRDINFHGANLSFSIVFTKAQDT
jgi:hypothetical protein